MKIRIMVIAMTALMLLLNHCTHKDGVKKNQSTQNQEDMSEAELNKRIILEINESKFTNADLNSFLKMQGTRIEDLKKTNNFRSRILDKFVNNKMIMYKVKQQNLRVDQDEVDEYLVDNHIPVAKADNSTIIENLLIQKYLFFNVYKNIGVTEKEIREYYNNNKDKFKKREEIKLYQILVKNKDKANKIWERLKNSPQNFEEIARNESVSLEAQNNGFMGTFEKGSLPLEMEEVVFSLKLNTISPVTESPYGFHIFKVTQKKKRRTQYLSKVNDQIKQELLSQKLNQAYLSFLANLKQELNITLNKQQLFFNYVDITGDTKNEY